MSILEDRLNIRTRLKCYYSVGNWEVKEMSEYILDVFQFYIEETNYSIPNSLLCIITDTYNLTYSKEELLEFIELHNLIGTKQALVKKEKAEDSPI